MKYKRRPATVEAMQLTKDNRDEVIKWIGDPTAIYNTPHDIRNIHLAQPGTDRHEVLIPGDYVIRMGKAPNYAFEIMARDFFEMQYEKVTVV